MQVSWETVSELNNAGFNLYRALAADGQRSLLAYMPPAAPGSTAGAAYRVRDDAVAAGQTLWYWLEAVDVSGASQLFGPVSLAVEAPTAVTLVGWSSSSRAPEAVLAAALALTAALGGALIALARRARPRPR